MANAKLPTRRKSEGSKVLVKGGEERVLIKLNRKRKGQSTAEYAILIGLVISAAVAMQIYVKRGLQARVHRAVVFLANEVNAANANMKLGTTGQYEPYYLNTQFYVNRVSNANQLVAKGGNYLANEVSNVSRDALGYQRYEAVNQTD